MTSPATRLRVTQIEPDKYLVNLESRPGIQFTVELFDVRTYWVSSSRPKKEKPYLVDMVSEVHGDIPGCGCVGYVKKRTKRCHHIVAVEELERYLKDLSQPDYQEKDFKTI